jgi:hypothetical protein
MGIIRDLRDYRGYGGSGLDEEVGDLPPSIDAPAGWVHGLDGVDDGEAPFSGFAGDDVFTPYGNFADGVDFVDGAFFAVGLPEDSAFADGVELGTSDVDAIFPDAVS